VLDHQDQQGQHSIELAPVRDCSQLVVTGVYRLTANRLLHREGSGQRPPVVCYGQKRKVLGDLDDDEIGEACAARAPFWIRGGSTPLKPPPQGAHPCRFCPTALGSAGRTADVIVSIAARDSSQQLSMVE